MDKDKRSDADYVRAVGKRVGLKRGEVKRGELMRAAAKGAAEAVKRLKASRDPMAPPLTNDVALAARKGALVCIYRDGEVKAAATGHALMKALGAGWRMVRRAAQDRGG